MSSYKLYYYPFRIRGELARLLFAAAGVQFEDIRIPYGEDRPKNLPKLPFDQLPVLEVDGKYLGQSNAIARHLASEFGFNGKNKWESAEADMYSGVVEDIITDVAGILVQQDEKLKANLLQNFLNLKGPRLLNGFEEALTANPSGYLVGNDMTYADLGYYNALQFVSDVLKTDGDKMISNLPYTLTHQQRIQSLPRIDDWMKKRPKSDL